MSLTKLSLAGNNFPNPSPWKVWSKKIQESRKFFFSVWAAATFAFSLLGAAILPRILTVRSTLSILVEPKHFFLKDIYLPRKNDNLRRNLKSAPKKCSRLCILKVVCGEKEGGSKVYLIDGYYCGTVALGIFSSLDSAPILLITKEEGFSYIEGGYI